MRTSFNQDTVDYFASKAEYFEGHLREEIQIFVEQNCLPEGTQTYEDITEELFNLAKQQTKNNIEDWWS